LLQEKVYRGKKKWSCGGRVEENSSGFRRSRSNF
jgi:hypothetical protein